MPSSIGWQGLDLHEPDHRGHVVGFYDDDPVLVGHVRDHLAAALDAGHAVLVVASEDRRRELRAVLTVSGLDVAGAERDGRYLAVDAAATLAACMDGDGPDPVRFGATVGGLVATLASGGREVRVYGDMVSMLRAAGNTVAALAMEDLWNDLAAAHPFSLLCGYPACCLGQVPPDLLRAVEDRHTAVVPVPRSTSSLDELAARIWELERANHDLRLAQELTDLLQTVSSRDELGRVVTQLARRLFPRTGGALYLADAGATALRVVASWGEPRPPEDVVIPSHCCGFVRGGACRHLSGAPVDHLCLPLYAGDARLGLLHVRHGRPPRGDDAAVRHDRELAADVAGRLARSVANFMLRETLWEQSVHDPLTQLYNRRYLDEVLPRELRRAVRQGGPLSVLLVDVDHFKVFNDELGHDPGDRLLRGVAGYLAAGLRAEDVACRLGGDEFLAILPGTPVGRAAARAEELRAGIASLLVEARHAPAIAAVTVSIGVAGYPDHGADELPLLHAADAALYRAKQSGRNRVEVATLADGGPDGGPGGAPVGPTG